MNLDTQKTIALLMEVLPALRTNYPKGFGTLMKMSLEELALKVVIELTRDFFVQLLSEVEADQMVGWN